MDKAVKEKFLKHWKEYFDEAELPLAAYYTDEDTVPENKPSTTSRCLVADLYKVRNGTPLRFGSTSIGCPGGQRYSGFSETIGESFEYFLSYGIPEVVIFFAEPDVIAGLFTLANFDASGEGVVAPFGSGCSSIIMHPYLEGERDMPRCVFGLFDPSARPYVGSDCLSFAVPMNRFIQMVENMPESFLITSTWETLKKRL